MSNEPYGAILSGTADDIRASYEQWAAIPVDQEMSAPATAAFERSQTTIDKPFSVSGPGTYFGKARRTLTFEPSELEGWWFDRTDLPDSLPINVLVHNLWTTNRSLVLCSGSPHNYMRMVEHIVALKVGMRLDNVLIKMDSGDPPLFDRSSLDLVEAVEKSGLRSLSKPARCLTVREPVTVGGRNGSFLTFLPAAKDAGPRLSIDCAVDFKTAIGKQRIRFDVTADSFRHGAFARTNASLGMMIYCFTVGKLFADMRHLGYTMDNILIAGRTKYVNEPRMVHNGKSLEAAWHRATLDLLAAIALIDGGRFVGKVISYKAGHALDVHMIKKLYQNGVLVPFES